MKWLIASDLHGSAHYTRELLNAYDRENAGRMLLLGDVLYHGPRNELPRGYDPKAVCSLLHELRGRILCIRGNCDAEVDDMVLPFPILTDYLVIPQGNRLIHCTHGHRYNREHLPSMADGDVLLYGHTHVPLCEIGRVICLNPGSVSIPKENSWHGYMTLEDGRFRWMDFDGNEHRSINLT